MKQPNILFVFSDQHRKFDLGCYGNSVVKTPNLDALAEEGRRFEHCISNSPVCVPARGSLLTGLFPQKHGAYTNDMSIKYDVESIADVLKKGGYHTGYIGKWHLCGIPRNQAIDEARRLGFKEWKVANCNHDYLNCYYDDEENVRHKVEGYEPEIFGELGVEFVERNCKNNKPWALYLSFATPHDPHDRVGEKYKDIYENVDISLRNNTPDQIMQKVDHSFPKEQEKISAKGYYSHITAIDDQIGLLKKKLEEMGQLENTLIIYTADHGEMLGSHGHKDKQLPYEESIGVPLIAYWKNHILKGTSEELIGLVDLPASLLGCIGLQFSIEVDGENLSRIFLSEDGKGKDSCYIFDLYACHQAYRKNFPVWRGMRTKKYTYAITPEDECWKLFDNEIDPLQMNNLGENPNYIDIRRNLRDILEKHIKENDKLVSGDDYVRMTGTVEEFNNSQTYFGFPTLK